MKRKSETRGGMGPGEVYYVPCERLLADVHISARDTRAAERDFDVYMTLPASEGDRVLVGRIRSPGPAFLSLRDHCFSPESRLVVVAGALWVAAPRDEEPWYVLIQERPKPEND